MNHVALVGRLTADPTTRHTPSGKAVATFTLAVDRRFKQDGQPQADFIPCVAWGKTAEAAGKYLAKGNRCGVEGRIQIRSYDAQDGSKRYVTEVVVSELHFLENKKKDGGDFGEPIDESEIPFN